MNKNKIALGISKFHRLYLEELTSTLREEGVEVSFTSYKNVKNHKEGKKVLTYDLEGGIISLVFDVKNIMREQGRCPKDIDYS